MWGSAGASASSAGADIMKHQQAADAFLEKLGVRALTDAESAALEKSSPAASKAYELFRTIRSEVYGYLHPVPVDYGPNRAREVEAGWPRIAPPRSLLDVPRESVMALRTASGERSLPKALREDIARTVRVWEKRKSSSHFRSLRDHVLTQPERKPEAGSSFPIGFGSNSSSRIVEPWEVLTGGSFARLEREIAEKGRTGWRGDLNRRELPPNAADVARLAKEAYEAGLPRAGTALMELAVDRGLKTGSAEWKTLEGHRRNTGAQVDEQNRLTRLRIGG